MSDPTPKKRTGLYLGAAGLVIAALVGGGLVSRGMAEREQAAIAAENALPTVSLVQPRASEGGEIVLPGSLDPYNLSLIHI